LSVWIPACVGPAGHAAGHSAGPAAHIAPSLLFEPVLWAIAASLLATLVFVANPVHLHLTRESLLGFVFLVSGAGAVIVGASDTAAVLRLISPWLAIGLGQSGLDPKQRQNVLKAIEKLATLPAVTQAPDVVLRFPATRIPAPPLITLDRVKAGYGDRVVLDRLDLRIDPDDRIAGSWTEHFLGVPLDVERGLFNDVLHVELNKRTMIAHILRDNLRFIVYMVRKYGLTSLVKSLGETKAAGAAMPSIGTTTMTNRRVNPCAVTRSDRRALSRVLSFWKSKTVADELKNRLLAEKVFTGDMEGFSASLPSTTSRKDIVISLGAAMGVWQGHLILDHETPLKRGLLAMKREVEQIIERGGHTEDELGFLRSQVIALGGVITFSRRLSDHLRETCGRETDPGRKAILEAMARTTDRVPLMPAASFREAVQSYWTVKTAVELALPFNVHAPGRLDQYFGPYYEKDIREGRITKEEALDLLEELLLKIMTHNMRPDSNYQGSFGQRFEGSEPVT
ncbi:MAG: hypothetical protein EHM91_17480, partial [Planctomycetota bacterium]